MADIRDDTEQAVVRKQRDYTYLLTISLVAAGGEVVVLVYALGFPTISDGITAVTLATIVAMASLAVGAFGGFLFGIPRRLQNLVDQASTQTSEDSETERSRYAGNTNLEQISDWLTKIIVGIGLVEIGTILSFIKGIGNEIATSVGQPNKPAFPVAIIIFFNICGFLIGYLWARLDLGRAFEESEKLNKLEKKLDQLAQQHEADVIAINKSRLQLSDNASQRPSQEELNQAILSASTEIRAYIFYMAQHARSENWRDKKGLMERTIRIFKALINSDLDQNYHRNYAQLAYALKDQRKPEFREAELQFTEAINLRGSAAEHGFIAYEANRAICRIKLDQNFAQRQPSEIAIKNDIISDIQVTFDDYWTKEWIQKDKMVNDWMELNQLSWKQVMGWEPT